MLALDVSQINWRTTGWRIYRRSTRTCLACTAAGPAGAATSFASWGSGPWFPPCRHRGRCCARGDVSHGCAVVACLFLARPHL